MARFTGLPSAAPAPRIGLLLRRRRCLHHHLPEQLLDLLDDRGGRWSALCERVELLRDLADLTGEGLDVAPLRRRRPDRAALAAAAGSELWPEGRLTRTPPPLDSLVPSIAPCLSVRARRVWTRGLSYGPRRIRV